MPRTNRPISVTLGALQSGVETRVKSAAYDSASEAMRAGLRAPEREEAASDDLLRHRVDEAFADPGPNVPAAEVFKPLRSHHARRVKARRREKA